MRVLVTTWGSRGEFQPYLALARAFIDAGHEARIGAPPSAGFAELAAEQGVPFLPLGSPLEPAAILDLQQRLNGVGDRVKIIRVILDELLLPSMDRAYQACREAASSADVIVSHFLQLSGRMAAESLGIPFVSGTLEPNPLPGRFQPPAGMPDLGRLGNPLLWKIAGLYVTASWVGGINQLRGRAGLPPFRNLLADGLFSRDLNLVAVSPGVAPPAPDWAPRHRFTGFWFLEAAGETLPPEVMDFLAAGAAPVAITFSSNPGSDGATMSGVLLDAVERAGVRAIIEPGGTNLGQGALPAGVLRAEITHARLFPHVAAVVHHGGAGTTAAAFRAGVPSVCLPDFWDQDYWAGRACALGAAPPPLAREGITADALAAAIRRATGDAGMKRRAAQLGAVVRAERGTETAVALVERFVESESQRRVQVAAGAGRGAEARQNGSGPKGEGGVPRPGRQTGGTQMALMKEKRINMGQFQLSVGMELERAERLRQSAAYRRVLRPALSLLEGRLAGRRNGHANGNGHAATEFPSLDTAPSPEARAIIDKIAGVDWYHVIDLPHGVSTPGFVDHRDQLHLYGLPDDMHGLRVLDVATYDGFWAREMERRGAEVVAIDIPTMRDVDLPRNWPDELEKAGLDMPTGAGFRIASEILGSKVQREILSVYDLAPDKLGMFDVAYCGDLLLHLRDPLKAMENIWSVVRQYAIFADVYNPDLEGIKDRPLTEFAMGDTPDMWWRPNTACLVQMLRVARFSRIEEVSRFQLKANIGRDIHKVVLRAYR